jgi:hypothetical protein
VKTEILKYFISIVITPFYGTIPSAGCVCDEYLLASTGQSIFNAAPAKIITKALHLHYKKQYYLLP